MIHVTVVIGSRANFSSTLPIMQEIQNAKDFILDIVCFESAVSERYGDISMIIENMGFNVNSRIHSLTDGDPLGKMVFSTASAMTGFGNYFANIDVDYVVVVGDRYEMLAPVIAASYMNIKVLHTMGGELTGTIDESIRHAITKLSHLHCVATHHSAKRVIKMGENPNTVFNTGCPRIDIVKSILEEEIDVSDVISNEGVGSKINLNDEFLLLSFHPVTTELDQARNQASVLLDAVSECNIPTMALWPNSDGGSDYISKEIRSRRESGHLPNFRIFRNFSVPVYTTLMRKCSVLVGNSSSGIREGAYIGTPVVDIGTRQKHREKASNVINIGFNKSDIMAAISAQLKAKRYPRSDLYGSGNASSEIVNILRSATVKVQKEFYLCNS